MNVYLWSLVLTFVGAILVALSALVPPLIGAGLLIAGVGLLLAIFSLVAGLEESSPTARNRLRWRRRVH